MSSHCYILAVQCALEAKYRSEHKADLNTFQRLLSSDVTDITDLMVLPGADNCVCIGNLHIKCCIHINHGFLSQEVSTSCLHHLVYIQLLLSVNSLIKLMKRRSKVEES